MSILLGISIGTRIATRSCSCISDNTRLLLVWVVLLSRGLVFAPPHRPPTSTNRVEFGEGGREGRRGSAKTKGGRALDA